MGARFSAPVQTGPEAHPASCTMGTGSLPGVKSGRGVTLTPHSLLVPWSRKGRAIPLLPLWAVRPVQSLTACTRVHFTFTFYCNNEFLKESTQITIPCAVSELSTCKSITKELDSTQVKWKRYFTVALSRNTRTVYKIG